MTIDRAITVMGAAAILRDLRAEPVMRERLNTAASGIMRAAIAEGESLIAVARRRLSDLRHELREGNSAMTTDDLILSNALEGVVILLLPD